MEKGDFDQLIECPALKLWLSPYNICCSKNYQTKFNYRIQFRNNNFFVVAGWLHEGALQRNTLEA